MLIFSDNSGGVLKWSGGDGSAIIVASADRTILIPKPASRTVTAELKDLRSVKVPDPDDEVCP